MNTTLLIAIVLLIAVGVRYLTPSRERCPECNALREDDTPLCECGWIFEFDDEKPLQYGEVEDEETDDNDF